MSSSAGRVAPPLLGDAAEPSAFTSATEHFFAELEWLRLVLQREVLRLRAAGLFVEDQFRGFYVPDEQVDAVLQSRYAELVSQKREGEVPPRLQDLNLQIQQRQGEIAARAEAGAAAGAGLPLIRMAELFELSWFECKVLVICAAAEVDLEFETLYSYARNDVTRKRPSVDLMLRLLCRNQQERLRYRSAFLGGSRLLRHHLIRFAEEPQDREPSFLARSLKADERIVSFLLGQSSLDGLLRPFTSLLKPERALSSLHFPAALSRQLKNALHGRKKEGGIFFFHGPRGAGKHSAAEALCAEAGRPLLAADMKLAVMSGVPMTTIFSLLGREAVLQGADVFLAHAEALQGDDLQSQQHRVALEQSFPLPGVRVFVGSEEAWPTLPWRKTCAGLDFEFPIPSFADRMVLWNEALDEAGCVLEPGAEVSSLASKFVLTGGEIRASCREALNRASLRGVEAGPLAIQDLEASARSQSSHGLRRLAQKITALSEWSTLVLPPHAVRQLRDVCAAEKYRQVVYTKWGFERRLAMGRGLNVLFCGSSGTGKTMAAGIVARELGLDLYKIDLSIVVSKYIGETEKQLSQIFREARSSNAILFFDEADALFGKRSEVKDAHDRYANVEVAYLLQKMEEYEGIVILATNLRKNMDDAFTRRMHHIMEFPFPEAQYRERIWKGMIPSEAPLAGDVDFGFLARQFELAGGNIRNIALAAAFLAAEEGSPMRMEHFTVATARELQKMGKLPSRSDFREYYELIRGKA